MSELKILSYNIHKGFSPTNQKFTLDKMKQAIESVGADIVFLQEVQGRHDGHAQWQKHWPTNSQFEYLADTLWPHFAYGKNAVYSEGHHGNAILSKFPIVEWTNHDVSTNRYESRGILHSVIEIPESGKKIHCLCLHFNLLQSGRNSQLVELCKIVHDAIEEEDHFIIAGDFNDWRHKASPILESSLEVQELFAVLNGKYAASYPARFPMFRLDRIYFRGLIPISAKVLRDKEWRSLSDHAALLGSFRLPG